MYTLTLIRLNASNKVFENTEINSILLLGDLEREFAKKHVPFTEVEEVLVMQKGDRKIIEITRDDKQWFFYIHKIS